MAPAASASPLVRIALIGATGRMGQAVLRAAPHFPGLIVTAAIASPGSLALGRDAGAVAGIGATNLLVTSDLPAALGAADVVIDFSDAAATAANLAACRAAGRPLLIGTTGLGAALEPALAAAARDIALLIAPNTSLAVALLAELVRTGARALPASFDIDVIELHHRGKQDAPSGTALMLRAAIGEGRPEGTVGMASLRAGDLVGEHTVLFCGPGEQLSLTHRATDRGIFARGALTAALWLVAQPAGRYTMRDFIGYKTAV